MGIYLYTVILEEPIILKELFLSCKQY